MDPKTRIRRFILENYLFTTDEKVLRDRDSLMARGVIDSTGALEVILFLEEQFDIDVEEEEMIPENLDSVENLVGYVERKLAARV